MRDNYSIGIRKKVRMKWFLETSHKKTKPSIMSLLNLGINWADTQKRQFCESFILFSRDEGDRGSGPTRKQNHQL